jgi:O-Antigen ligase
MLGIILMGFNRSRLGGWTISDLAFVASAVVIVFKLLSGRDRDLASPAARKSSPPILIGAIVLLTAGTLSAFDSWAAGRSIAVVLRFAWITLGWFWVLRTVCVDRVALNRLLWSVRAMLIINALIGTLSHLGVVHWTVAHIENRQTGFFATPNDFAGLIAVGIPFAVMGLPRLKPRPEGREYLARSWVIGLACYAIAATGSMSALIAIVAGVLALGIGVGLTRVRRPSWPRRSPLPMMAIAFVALVGMVALVSSDLPVVDRFTRYTSGDNAVEGSVNTRADRNAAVVQEFDTTLLIGRGFGGYDPSDATEVTAAGAHNMFMRIVFQAGLPGLVGLLILLGVTLQHIWRLMVNTRAGPLHPITIGLFGALITANTFAMFQPTEFHRYYWLPVGLIGAVWSLRRQELQQQPASTRRG